jgi:hypothetical protein
MTLTLHIPDEDVPALKTKARGLPLETFAESVLMERIHGNEAQTPDQSVAAAARRLGTFGKRHGLSLGGITVRELLEKSRP